MLDFKRFGNLGFQCGWCFQAIYCCPECCAWLAIYSRPTMAYGATGSGLKPPMGSGPQWSAVDSNRSATAQLSGQFTVEYN